MQKEIASRCTAEYFSISGDQRETWFWIKGKIGIEAELKLKLGLGLVTNLETYTTTNTTSSSVPSSMRIPSVALSLLGSWKARLASAGDSIFEIPNARKGVSTLRQLGSAR